MSSEIDPQDEDGSAPRPHQSAVPRERPGKPGGRRDTNRRERTSQLCDAALALFLERGIEGATIDDITKAAGTAKGSFYRYFPSKAALVTALFEPVKDSVEKAFDDAGKRLADATSDEAMNAAYVSLGEELGLAVFRHLEVVQLYLQENRGPRSEARAPVRNIADLIANGAIVLTEKARTHGLLRPFPAEVSALTVVGATERLLFAVLVEERIESPLELPEQLTSLVLDGLRVAAPGTTSGHTRG